MSCRERDIKALLGTLSPPKKNNYYYGKMLDVHHLEMEQQYGDQKRWLLNRLTLGDGVICGLDVKSKGGKLHVSCGVAVDCFGREIIVPEGFEIDPWKFRDVCGEVEKELAKDEEHVVLLSVCYRSCFTDHGPVLVTDCDAHDDSKPGTVLESYRPHLRLVKDRATLIPKAPISDKCCAEISTGDPPCTCEQDSCCTTEDCCVALAAMRLTKKGKIATLDTCGVRKRIYSQQQLMGMVLCLAKELKSVTDNN